MSPFLQSLIFAFAAAWANILGGVIVTSHKWARKSLQYFIALGSGFMLGTVFLEMIPESFALTRSAPALVLLGYLIVHMFEHTFASHLHFGEETHHEELVNPVVRVSALVGMLVHTFFDGVAIGAGFVISPSVGLLIFLAVFLHKIPDGFTISSIVISSGQSNSRALAAATALGVSTLIGVVVVHLAGDSVSYALPISTGSTLYVAATDLMPEVNREKGVKMAVVVFAGMGLFLLVRLIAHF
ncbi:MAG TPA: ZIP family metal transporter [Terriglobia bacterium]|nr:ZIP family metal transporter [Terriglobia bacterium]